MALDALLVERLLHPVPGCPVEDRLVPAREALALVAHLADVDGIAQDDPNNPNGGILDMELLSDFLRRYPSTQFLVAEAFTGLAGHPNQPAAPGLDAETVDASFKNGVLTIRKPHSPESKFKMKRIEVRSA